MDRRKDLFRFSLQLHIWTGCLSTSAFLDQVMILTLRLSSERPTFWPRGSDGHASLRPPGPLKVWIFAHSVALKNLKLEELRFCLSSILGDNTLVKDPDQ